MPRYSYNPGADQFYVTDDKGKRPVGRAEVPKALLDKAGSAVQARPPQVKTSVSIGASGPRFSVSSTPTKLGAMEQQSADTIKGVLDQLNVAREDLKNYGSQRWQRGLAGRWMDYGKRSVLHESTADPQLNQLMDHLIAINAQSKAALMRAAGTRAVSYANDAVGHLPHAAGDYDYNMDAMNYLLSPQGPYRSYLKAVGVNYNPQASEAARTPAMPGTVPIPAGATVR